MTSEMFDEWSKRNQHYLVECVEHVKASLRNSLAGSPRNNNNTNTITTNTTNSGPDTFSSDAAHVEWNYEGAGPALDYLCDSFDLSNFERSILILCAGVELDAEVSQLCSRIQNGISSPTFSLALSILPESHWSALVPTRPLRKFRLIQIDGSVNGSSSSSSNSSLQHVASITRCPLRIDERILHYLAGIAYMDRDLSGIASPVRLDNVLITASQKNNAHLILDAWKSKAAQRFNLTGSDEPSKVAIAAWAARQLGFRLWHVPGELVPTRPDELESFIQLWTRESILLNAGLYISASDLELAIQRPVKRLVDLISGPVFFSTIEPWSVATDSIISLSVSKPTKVEQYSIWKSLLENSTGSDGEEIDAIIRRMVNQFDLNGPSIRTAALEAIVVAAGGTNLSTALWSSALKAARPRLAELAQPIKPKAKINDLVLPERESQLLKSTIIHVRHRYKVYEEWGFGASERGLGTSVLFAGPSGTGKTMAAEAMANELELDLFRIDLSMVMNKYIGETEKNLRKIFDAAEDGGAVLFFDEADALFGKRSEVRDSHDRFANVSIDYILQRMESYRGLAILATNMKQSIDTAFLRRIRFIVNFPMPDEKSRLQIWQRVFPRSAPTATLDFELLSKLDIAGGHIHNIALGAAFLAAEEDVPISMTHMRGAAQQEFDKIERPMPNIVWEK